MFKLLVYSNNLLNIFLNNFSFGKFCKIVTGTFGTIFYICGCLVQPVSAGYDSTMGDLSKTILLRTDINNVIKATITDYKLQQIKRLYDSGPAPVINQSYATSKGMTISFAGAPIGSLKLTISNPQRYNLPNFQSAEKEIHLTLPFCDVGNTIICTAIVPLTIDEPQDTVLTQTSVSNKAIQAISRYYISQNTTWTFGADSEIDFNMNLPDTGRIGGTSLTVGHDFTNTTPQNQQDVLNVKNFYSKNVSTYRFLPNGNKDFMDNRYVRLDDVDQLITSPSRLGHTFFKRLYLQGMEVFHNPYFDIYDKHMGFIAPPTMIINGGGNYQTINFLGNIQVQGRGLFLTNAVTNNLYLGDSVPPINMPQNNLLDNAYLTNASPFVEEKKGEVATPVNFVAKKLVAEQIILENEPTKPEHVATVNYLYTEFEKMFQDFQTRTSVGFRNGFLDKMNAVCATEPVPLTVPTVGPTGTIKPKPVPTSIPSNPGCPAGWFCSATKCVKWQCLNISTCDALGNCTKTAEECGPLENGANKVCQSSICTSCTDPCAGIPDARPCSYGCYDWCGSTCTSCKAPPAAPTTAPVPTAAPGGPAPTVAQVVTPRPATPTPMPMGYCVTEDEHGGHNNCGYEPRIIKYWSPVHPVGTPYKLRLSPKRGMTKEGEGGACAVFRTYFGCQLGYPGYPWL